MLSRLRHDAEVHPEDGGLKSLVEELFGYPRVDVNDAVRPWATPSLLMTIHHRTPELDLRLFSTIVSVGSPHDVTLQELSAELFFPADQESARALRNVADQPAAPGRS